MSSLQKTCTVIICVVLCAIAFTAVFAFFNSQHVASKKENRALAKPPAYTLENWFSGDFDVELDDYLSDHVAFRGKLIDITKTMENWMSYHAAIRIIDR